MLASFSPSVRREGGKIPTAKPEWGRDPISTPERTLPWSCGATAKQPTRVASYLHSLPLVQEPTSAQAGGQPENFSLRLLLYSLRLRREYSGPPGRREGGKVPRAWHWVAG